MFKLKQNEEYYGFVLEEIQELPDIRSTGFLFSHTKSGAKLYYVKNDDDNKVFSITFKTPPKDNCGTPHILEHSVLCGSRKFGVKDPFNELAKGSMHTYLNALTYGDKTMYPVASRNEKDLMNMMDVYLDAVFYPRIAKEKAIFLQEGWHYEWNNDGELAVSGVVYNEMKGALSDPEAILQNCIARSLFKTSIYGFESGGDPEYIPDLSYEEFIAFHQKYYHPSNSFLYIYGDMDIEMYLEFIHNEYLSAFEKTNVQADIMLEAALEKPVTALDYYPVENIKKDDKGYLSYNMKAGYCTDPERIMALQILNEILMETNASPLKKALIESGIAVDAEGWLDSSALEMVYSIVAKKVKQNDLLEFQKIIDGIIESIIRNGLDKTLVASCIQKYEFYYREEDFGQRPKGLTYGMKLMKSWLHGADPKDALNHWKHFDKIKEQSKYDYFEKLLQKLFFTNTEKSFVAAQPKAGLQRELDNAFRLKMSNINASLTNQQKDAIRLDLEKLSFFQKKEETLEELAQIPMLSVSDISRESEIVPLNERQAAGCKVLYSPMNTNGIIYMQMLFDISSLSDELLPYAGLLAHIIGKLDTEKYSYDVLPIEIGLHTGGIHCTNDIYSKDNLHCSPFFVVNGKTLRDNQETLIHLIDEILRKTDFSNTVNLKKIIGAAKIHRENQLLNSSHTTAILKSASAIAVGSYKKDNVAGISFVHFLDKIEDDLENGYVSLVEKLEQTLKLIINKQNLTIAVACEEEAVSSFIKQLERCIRNLPQTTTKLLPTVFVPSPIRQAYTGASKVQYNVCCQNFLSKGFLYSGKMRLLKTILDLEYLWNRVRVQGGAYGGGCNFFRNGNYYFYSYRDPNIENTFNAYLDAGNFLESFCDKDVVLDKYIIGAINAVDQPKSNAEKFDLALSRYFGNVSAEQLQNERMEVLNAKTAELKPYVNLLKHTELENICTIGNRDTIDKSSNFFDTINTLIP